MQDDLSFRISSRQAEVMYITMYSKFEGVEKLERSRIRDRSSTVFIFKQRSAFSVNRLPRSKVPFNVHVLYEIG